MEAKLATTKYTTFIDTYRSKAFRTNRKLYRLSKDFLEMEAIRQKNDLLKALGYWNDIMLGYGFKQKNAISAVLSFGIEKYFKLISLAYPVHTSSIHASPTMFKHFF